MYRLSQVFSLLLLRIGRSDLSLVLGSHKSKVLFCLGSEIGLGLSEKLDVGEREEWAWMMMSRWRDEVTRNDEKE